MITKKNPHMKTMLPFRAMIAALALLALPATSRADIIYDVTGQNSNDFVPFENDGTPDRPPGDHPGNPITFGGTERALFHVQAVFASIGPREIDTYTLELYRNDGPIDPTSGRAGALVAASGHDRRLRDRGRQTPVGSCSRSLTCLARFLSGIAFHKMGSCRSVPPARMRAGMWPLVLPAFEVGHDDGSLPRPPALSRIKAGLCLLTPIDVTITERRIMSVSPRKSKKFQPALDDRLEDRTVPSHSGLGGFLSSQLGSFLGGLEQRGGLLGGRDFGGGYGYGGHGGGLGGITQPGSGAASTSTLKQDARLVQQAFRTLNSSFLSAAAGLRQTATSTAGPTQAGLDTYNAAISTATSKLNSSIGAALGNLTNTGSALVSTIGGYTATLQTELQSAGGGLASSTNQAVLSLKQEANSYIRNTLNQTTGAILTNQPSGSLTRSTLQTYNQALGTAYQAFNQSIANAKQTAISAGARLDSTAVQSAVSSLQTALTSAINGLGTPFSSSTYNPTSTVTAQLSTLQTQLLAITAPMAGSNSSAWLFSRSVSSVIRSNLGTINQAVATAVQGYNNSLV
jgi:hypothetical protein